MSSKGELLLIAHSSSLIAGFMRLFLALDIDDAIRDRLTRFLEGVRNFAPDARWVNPESLHVTLKFIGEQPEAAVIQIKQTLANRPGISTAIHFQGYGFFPTRKSAAPELPARPAGAKVTSPIPRSRHCRKS